MTLTIKTVTAYIRSQWRGENEKFHSEREREQQHFSFLEDEALTTSKGLPNQLVPPASRNKRAQTLIAPDTNSQHSA